jgi:predicted TIM-barrel fold metal-dependent hydrolase
MPLQEHMRLISVDDHVVEHPQVWTDRLPAALRERGPRVIDAKDGMLDLNGKPLRSGSQAWMFDDKIFPTIALNAVAGKAHEDYSWEPYRFEDVRRGCWDPVARLADFDQDGIYGSLAFPTFPGFAGAKFITLTQDRELALACVQAYNDFMLDEWCAADPDRFIPMVILPLWDVEASVKEVKRTAAKGAKALSVPDSPAPLGLPSYYTDHWDPLLAVVEEAGLPLCKHFGTSGTSRSSRQVSPETPETVMISLAGCLSMFALADLLQSPVLHKFPRLKVAMSEGGIGWIPYLLERMDHVWARHRHYETNVNQTVSPSELFQRNVWGCFIDDEIGIKLRHDIGLSRITWECDYPHSDTNWPNARAAAAKQLQDVPDDEVHQIVELNARTLLNLPAPVVAR